MKKTTLTLIASFIACSTLFSGMTRAEGPDDHRWEQHGGGPRTDNGRGPAHADQRRADRGPGPEHRERIAERRLPEGHHDADRFAWNGHDFRLGHPAPPEFRGPHYRVDDWRTRGLYAPPRGEHWAYIDGNYVLVAAATGIISAILLNNAIN